MEQQNFVPGSGKTQCMGCMQFYNAEFDVCPFCGYQKDTPVKAPWHIKPGTLLVGRYVIGRVVGYGGFGVTYIAWDTMLKRRIAIKEYLPSEFATRMADEQEIMLLDGEKQLSQYQKGLDRFLQEGKRLAQVGDISGIVHMYNCFQANGTAYITMEFSGRPDAGGISGGKGPPYRAGDPGPDDARAGGPAERPRKGDYPPGYLAG